MISNERPLAGIRVLDLSRILAGPVCTQVLADLGADVVKVERPKAGDDTRQWGPPFLPDGGTSAYFLSCNRGKRSLALDLESASGGSVLRDLISHADVLVENFRRESLEKLHLTPREIAAANPQLVVCSISGFGRTGPMADVPGYDLMVQACAGLMSITGEPDGAPMKVGVAISDVITGLYGVISILAGLVQRPRSERGIHFELALADCTMASLVNVIQSAILTGQTPKRHGNAHAQIVPYEVFATSDGHIVLAVGADRQWERFCRLIGEPDLAKDPLFRTNPLRVQHRDQLIPRLQKVFAARDTSAWLKLLAEGEIPHSKIVRIDELLNDPQVRARNMTQTVTDAQGRTFQLVGSPIHWFGMTHEASTPPPNLGQHTDEVLAQWVGYDRPKIDLLRQQGVIE